MKYLKLLILITLTSTVFAENKMSLEDYCKSKPCRKDLTVTLKQRDGSIYSRTQKLLPPVIQPSFFSIYAGEAIYIEADEGKDKPTNLVHVKEIKNPKKTIVFKFEQNKAIGDGKSMLLTVQNPFSKPIRYNVGMMPLDDERLLKTSSCPVMANGSVFESWPFPIFQLVFTNMHFQKENDDGACK